MDQRDVDRELSDTELLVFAKGSMAYMKQLLSQCLAADIPAMLGRPPDAGKG